MMEGTASGFVGILYAEDFDDPQLPPPEPAPAPPGFTADEIDAARQAACAEAVEAARDEWESSALHGRTQSLAAIAGLLADAQQEAGALADTVADGVARTILSMLPGCCRTFAPAMARPRCAPCSGTCCRRWRSSRGSPCA